MIRSLIVVLIVLLWDLTISNWLIELVSSSSIISVVNVTIAGPPSSSSFSASFISVSSLVCSVISICSVGISFLNEINK